MQRWKITIEYDGTSYAGWQVQDDLMTVQYAVEEAIKKLSGETVRVHVCGRTDSGVHALGQVAHFDLKRPTTPKEIQDGLTHYLMIGNHAVVITNAEQVSDEFHARFHATMRYYRYDIMNRHAPIAIKKNYAWHVRKKLNIQAMQEGANHLLGEHDFTSFRASECQAKSPIKTVETITVTREGDVVSIHVSARSFLHHQVRNFVGTLKKVGEERWSPQKVKEALEAKDRAEAGPTAPSQGLFFVKVDYN